MHGFNIRAGISEYPYVHPPMVEIHYEQNKILVSGQVIKNINDYYFLLDYYYSGLVPCSVPSVNWFGP